MNPKIAKRSALVAFFYLALSAPLLCAQAQTVKEENLPTAKDHAELQKLLKWHIWYGKPITRGVRAAAGDPDMAVFDNRRTRNLTHMCSYIIYRGKRAIRCE